ncbi:MAG: tRNA (N(6)-L-threonylcarbamoyladenosine(37)-C(2))-methylthiotransferase MtaB [Clostridia bacterium]
MENNNAKVTISVFTLGCKTNYYESQQIVADLISRGYGASDGLKMADIYIINTCAITAEAESKSRQAVARAKKFNPKASVIVVGCASQNNPTQFSSLTNVVYLSGNADKLNLGKVVDDIASKISQNTCLEQITSIDTLPNKFVEGIYAYPSHTRAYIKIQDGCNNFCSYCLVPYLRGRNRSRSVESIVDEVKQTKSNEYVLTGIDISQYGVDINTNLSTLLNALQFADCRIRLGSIYQCAINGDLLSSMQKNVCKHLHLSLQSGCDNTLRAMNRHYTTKEYENSVNLIRSYYPNISITTDVIVGFCGETNQDFCDTVDFINKIKFADIHIFPFSPRKKTKAYGLEKPNSLVVKQRLAILTELKHKLRSEYLTKQIGTTTSTLVEEIKSGYYVGYTDNYCKVYVKEKVAIGEFVNVKLKELYLDGILGVVES